MIGRARSWREINNAVEGLIDHHVENDPTVNAFMIASSALHAVMELHGKDHAAQLAYRLADQLVARAA